MIKILSVFVFLSSTMLAQNLLQKSMNFDDFLDKAIQNSLYLKSSKIDIDKATQQQKVLTRYQNPLLALEYSEFRPDNGDSKNGYRVEVMQPVRLWGVGDDIDSLGQASKEKAQANYHLSRAQFIYSISLLFTKYAQKKELHLLAEDEQSIALRIYEIAQARLDAGTISKGEMLQARVDFEMAEIRLDTLSLSVIDDYFSLLESAGYSSEVTLNHHYNFSTKNTKIQESNPNIMLIKKSQEEAIAKSRVDTHKIEWMAVKAEYEKEPNEDIFRVGVVVPLAIFKSKKEEQRISSLELDRVGFELKRNSDKITLKIKKLHEEKILLQKLRAKNEQTLKTQEELLLMFEDSYKIANINLLELQDIKNRVIDTKKSLIKIKSTMDTNAINTNYTLGVYNE